MTSFILAPVITFFSYFLVISIVSGLARLFAASGLESEFKSATYASGEKNDPTPAAYGYRKFFVIALFFAVLHLGVLMLGSSGLSPAAVPYLLGLMLVLIALILG
jgi:NADH:ubiquinone oxidoreductase subunit 3 (subunit A)